MAKPKKVKKTVKATLEWAEKQAKLASEAVKEPKAQADAPVEPEVMDMDDAVVPGMGGPLVPEVFNNRGRPSKYIEAFADQAKILCSKGFTDADLGDFFMVTEQTINNWKTEFPLFFESIKQGKKLMDAQVEKSLLHRALGYTVKEEKVFCSEGSIVTHETLKHFPPDPTSMIFWLKNRKPKEWRDKHEVDFVSPLTIKMDEADQKTL